MIRHRKNNTCDAKTMLKRVAASFAIVTRVHSSRFAAKTRRLRRVCDLIGTDNTTHDAVEALLLKLKQQRVVNKDEFKTAVLMTRKAACHRNIFDQEARHLEEQLTGKLLNRQDSKPVHRISAKTGVVTRCLSLQSAAVANKISRDRLRAALVAADSESVDSDSEADEPVDELLGCKWRWAPPLECVALPTPTNSLTIRAPTVLITTEMRDPARVAAKKPRARKRNTSRRSGDRVPQGTEARTA